METCSPSSTEAHRPNPRQGCRDQSRCSIRCSSECGRQGKTSPPEALRKESQRSGAATSEAGASGASCSDKSPRGVTAAMPYNPELPRGVLDLATGGTGRMCMRSASRESGRRIAQPRKATTAPRVGSKDRLAVSVIGDGAEPRQTAHRWVGGTLHVLTSEKPRPDDLVSA